MHMYIYMHVYVIYTHMYVLCMLNYVNYNIFLKVSSLFIVVLINFSAADNCAKQYSLRKKNIFEKLTNRH